MLSSHNAVRILELFVRCRLGDSNLLVIFFNSEGLGKWCLLYQSLQLYRSLHHLLYFTDSFKILYALR
jgi:hypothetical protein